ncbi:RimJ/RimL family protein N-acetyltransferase [Thermocatellispora tengchongensis]|uniref:RimJ/RimL family protein N-acetyltransferase n=1 Tax=Thermocatellispora tengchongensis TaxID=1073253 RepID=A0A840PI02_9ACTN|nr:GNAT family protein [Thermocatellispora tengchongensis]MBB5139178.1 RimJ/RimL family protein N-acetyltransferase [Thermocatellispora tengchongensis]
MGDLVRLRAIEPWDSPLIYDWLNDAEVTRWMTGTHPLSLMHIEQRAASRPRNSYERMQLGIVALETDELIGVGALLDAEPETGDAELSLYIGDRSCWGRGYATDALRVLCSYGFDEMRLHRISLWVVAENTAAIRVYEKVGFVREGVRREAFRRGGKWHDFVLMGLLEGELR